MGKLHKTKNCPCRGSFTINSYFDILDHCDIYCVESSFSLLYLVGNFVVFTNAAVKPCYVYKQIVASVFWSDETEAFGFIEKFDCSFVHFRKN